MNEIESLHTSLNEKRVEVELSNLYDTMSLQVIFTWIKASCVRVLCNLLTELILSTFIAFVQFIKINILGEC